MPGHYDTTDPYSVSSTKSNQNYGSASKSGMQSKQGYGSGSKSGMQSKQTNPSGSKSGLQGKQSSWNSGYDKTNQVSPNHPSGNYQDNKTKPHMTYNSHSNSDKNAGFINKDSNDDKNTNDDSYKNPHEETRQAGLDYITSTTGETELEYWKTRNEISNYNKEHNFGDATIDLDNWEIRKLWNDVKDELGDEAITKKSMIKVLNKFADEGRKTFGTGLRGDARWKGYIGTGDDYSDKLRIMTGNYDPNSAIGKYQRALINANKPLRGTTGDKIFGALLSIIGGPVGTAFTAGKMIYDSIMPEKQDLPSDGIFVLEMDGDYININEETSEYFSDFDMRTLDKTYKEQLHDKDNPRENNYLNTNTNTNINIDSPSSQYGLWIGRDESLMYTTDFIDSDGDGIDDRWQTGPGQPSQQPTINETETPTQETLNNAYPWWPWDVFIEDNTEEV
tara:strand:- start:2167 stop:3510 length:1344 start_codon:yes stop_codon:yes gene_type:complete